MIHGIGGGYMKTWTAANGCCWPKDLLPNEVPGALVLSWAFNSHLIGDSKLGASIQTHATALLADLNRYRSERVRPLSINTRSCDSHFSGNRGPKDHFCCVFNWRYYPKRGQYQPNDHVQFRFLFTS